MNEKIVQTAGRDCGCYNSCNYVCGMAERLGGISSGKGSMAGGRYKMKKILSALTVFLLA